MRPVLTRAAAREFDRRHIDAGVSGQILMENAGRGAAHLIGLKARPRPKGEAPRQGSSVAGSCVRCADERALGGAKFTILCGSGNNGGDGFVVARHLFCRGAEVRVFATVERAAYRGDARLALEAMLALGLPLEFAGNQQTLERGLDGSDIVVDALLGTGAERPLTGLYLDLVKKINESATRVIALDLPSGLSAETGGVLGAAVKAAHTVTFAHLKKGLLTTHGHAHSGTITVANIGVPMALPNEIEPAAWLLEESDAVGNVSARSPVAHKGTEGRVVIVGGAPGTVGAARLAAHGALRAGGGLVTIASRASVISALEAEVREVMTAVLREGERNPALDRADAIVVGPGLGRDSEASAYIKQALAAGAPVVLDADGLRWASDVGCEGFRALGASQRTVLTPHAAEAGALLGQSAEVVEADRFDAAREIGTRFGATVILKGSRPVIFSPGRTPVVSAFGSAALATGGSGDVLSGILGALLVGARNQGEIFRRTQTAVAIQGICAERWTLAHGDRGLLASEVADLVPGLLRDWILVNSASD